MKPKHRFLAWLLGAWIMYSLAACLEGVAQDIAGVATLFYVFGGLTGWLVYLEMERRR